MKRKYPMGNHDRHKPGVVTSVKPDGRVWAEALRLAKGRDVRVEVVDNATVIIRNRAE